MANVDKLLAPPARRRPLTITENTVFLSVAQMGQRYSVSQDTIWRWVTAGHIPKPVKINRQVTRWRLHEVEAHDAARQPVEAA